jgi:DNA-binding HxlR family transcriptional regulator
MFAECRASETPLIRIGDKWTGRIIRCLEAGPRRFSELQTLLRGITPKVLTETLRAMERDGLIERTVYAEMPPRVEYELTSLGQALREPMATCCEWSEVHEQEILEAREVHERSALTQETINRGSGRE